MEYYSRLQYVPTSPKTDARLTIHPLSPVAPCSSCCNICPMTCLHPRNMDRALTAIVWSNHSSGVSWMPTGLFLASTLMPALLTKLLNQSVG